MAAHPTPQVAPHDERPPASLQGASARSETYALGYVKGFTDVLSRRTAHNSAAYLLPHLRPGMRVLDCGVGPGTISVGLARAVAPAALIGIDAEATQIERAKALAQEQSVDNAQFQVASVYELPFPDEHFDVAHANALFCHLSAPERALSEIRRVLRPSGLVALRDPYQSGRVFIPADLDMFRKGMKLIESSGGDPDRGIQLPKLVLDAGFELAAVDGDMDVWWTPESKAVMMDAARGLWMNGESGKRARESGMLTDEQIEIVLHNLATVIQQPAVWSAGPWFSVVGRKRA